MMTNFQFTRDWEATEWKSSSNDFCLCCEMRTGYDSVCFFKSCLWRSLGRKDRKERERRRRKRERGGEKKGGKALEAFPCEFK